jgi:hypothetical protein
MDSSYRPRDNRRYTWATTGLISATSSTTTIAFTDEVLL